MSYYRIKVKINDYFPKIDAIPFDHYICVISCNTSYSKIKLSEFKNQYFQHNFKLIKNTDLLFNIKLINYLDNNTLVGIYDLLIPYTKVNQILQRKSSFYQQQIKLIMNSNVKIKLFGTMMNITSIYLDLIFEISLIENNTPVVNKLRIYDIIGNNNINNINELLRKNYNKKLEDNNNNKYNNEFEQNKKINFTKSPNFTNIYDLYDDEIDYKKEIDKRHDYNYNKNIYKENHSDINYNVMNNNYLNYFQIDNTNFPINYTINNNKTPNNYMKNHSVINNIENNNKINEKINHKFNDNNIINLNKIKNENIKRYKRYDDISSSPFLGHTERNPNIDESEKFIKNSRNKNKYLTETKNSKESEIIRSEKKKLELNQNKKNLKFQNYDVNSINNNKYIGLNYVNYIKNNKPTLYNKKNQIEKYKNNKKTKKIPNSIKNLKNNDKLKIDISQNIKNIPKLKLNITFNSKTKTPSYSNLTGEQSINISNLDNKNDCMTDLNYYIDNEKIKKDKNGKIKISNSNCKNIKKYFIIKSDKKPKNVDSKNKNEIENDKLKNEIKNVKIDDEIRNDKKENEIENDKLKNEDDNKSNIINEKDKDLDNKNQLIIYTPEEIKDKAIQLLDNYIKSTKEIKEKMNLNKELFKKLLLCKEKYYTELKIKNRLANNTNNKDIKYLIHVNIHSKLNEKLYFNMKKIKIKEFKIFEKIFYEHKNSPEYKTKEAKRIMKEKLEQQKKVHALLKIIRDLIQKYENLSQLYNDDEKKKMLFKSLLVRYGIREKEESKENNLMDKFEEIQKKIEEEKNNKLIKIKKKEMQNDVYKNVIKEEDDEEKSSVSDRIRRGYSFKKKMSWASEDSVFKEKDKFESNKSINDEINNSLLSSGLKIIRENKDEDILNKNEDKKDSLDENKNTNNK